MATQTFTRNVVLVLQTCYSCATPFGMDTEFNTNRLRDHKTFYCPNGHGQVYTGETEEQRLKRQLGYANDERARLSAERDQIQASLRTTKGHVTRLRNRAIAGQCPICGQSLHDLARHVKRMHPDEQPEVES